MIDLGALPDEKEGTTNTMEYAIQTMNIKTIRIISNIVNEFVDNSPTPHNSLSVAIRTKKMLLKKLF